jgi:Icc-related predicted phosphoesterase
MRLLLFSDLHRDVGAAEKLLDLSISADVMVGAGDFATCRRGIQDCISVLRQARCPAVLVAGNGESHAELQQACDGWKNGHVLHGTGAKVAGVQFFGIGGAIPITPFGDWSWDFSEQQAEQLAVDCPEKCVLVSHSPPFGIVDMSSSGDHHGSSTIRSLIDRCRPVLVVCGHIHDSWTQRRQVGPTLVVNCGPRGEFVSL